MTDCNIPNRTISRHDNLDILRGINSECIDLIYLAPPFQQEQEVYRPYWQQCRRAEFRGIFREEDIKSEWLTTIKEDHIEFHE